MMIAVSHLDQGSRSSVNVCHGGPNVLCQLPLPLSTAEDW